MTGPAAATHVVPDPIPPTLPILDLVAELLSLDGKIAAGPSTGRWRILAARRAEVCRLIAGSAGPGVLTVGGRAVVITDLGPSIYVEVAAHRDLEVEAVRHNEAFVTNLLARYCGGADTSDQEFLLEEFLFVFCDATPREAREILHRIRRGRPPANLHRFAMMTRGHLLRVREDALVAAEAIVSDDGFPPEERPEGIDCLLEDARPP